MSLRNRRDQGGWSLAGDVRCPVGVGPGPRDLPSLARSRDFVLQSVGKHRQALDATYESAKAAWAVSRAVSRLCGVAAEWAAASSGPEPVAAQVQIGGARAPLRRVRGTLL